MRNRGQRKETQMQKLEAQQERHLSERSVEEDGKRQGKEVERKERHRHHLKTLLLHDNCPSSSPLCRSQLCLNLLLSSHPVLNSFWCLCLDRKTSSASHEYHKDSWHFTLYLQFLFLKVLRRTFAETSLWAVETKHSLDTNKEMNGLESAGHDASIKDVWLRLSLQLMTNDVKPETVFHDE